MRRKIYIACTLLLSLCGIATAQKVERYEVAVLTDNRVIYALPLTKLYLLVESEEVHETPGELALYAERYLGRTDAILEEHTYHHLKGIQMDAYGIPDEQYRYAIDFSARSNATNVTLSEDGILIGINKDIETLNNGLPTPKQSTAGKTSRASSIPLPSEYIQATTTATKAAILADEIYRTRDSKNIVASGESEQPFADGEALRLALKTLDEREQSFTTLFMGSREKTTKQEVVQGISATEEGKKVVARFSKQEGLLPADDLRGEPIYLDLKVVEASEEIDEHTRKKLEKKLERGIVYRVPGRVHATISFRGNIVLEKDIAVGQLGSLEALDMILFKTKGKVTSVELYPHNGGLKEVKELNE